MNSSFEYITALEYRLRAAKAELDAFKSGEQYIRMEELRLKEIRSLEHKIDALEKEFGNDPVKYFFVIDMDRKMS